jgi:cytosine/adenosine deaminase-related metal-dependent hydrolase
MPGLVNAHIHMWQTALRGIASEWMSPTYFRNMHSNIATFYQPEDNYIANLMGAVAQIDGGTTTVVDWCHNITNLEFAERAVDGLVDSGIRAVFAHGTAKPIGKETGTPFTHVPHPRDRIESLRKGRLSSDDARVTLAMAILGPDWGTWEVVEHDIRMARELGLVSSSHTRRQEDCVTPNGYARMAKAGLLGPDHNLVHGTSYNENELRVVIDSGATMTSTALVELHHHIGDPLVARVRAAGGMPSLGIDSEVFCTGHMLREMQAALLFVRGRDIRNNALLGNSAYQKMPVKSREALIWTTVGGAQAFRLENKIGTLTPGKKADIVMLRATDLNLQPVYDPIYSIVELATPGNVDTVIIDGVIRKQDGRMCIPPATLRQWQDKLAQSGERVIRESGFDVRNPR